MRKAGKNALRRRMSKKVTDKMGLIPQDNASILSVSASYSCCEMSARDNTDRSLARSAWESVTQKNRPVGYGMIRRKLIPAIFLVVTDRFRNL